MNTLVWVRLQLLLCVTPRWEDYYWDWTDQVREQILRERGLDFWPYIDYRKKVGQ